LAESPGTCCNKGSRAARLATTFRSCTMLIGQRAAVRGSAAGGVLRLCHVRAKLCGRRLDERCRTSIAAPTPCAFRPVKPR
jgi:hypothetical protein